MAHFQIPLDLPHAGKIAWRIHSLLSDRVEDGTQIGDALKIVGEIREMLEPFRETGENPADDEAKDVVEKIAAMGRSLVDQIVRHRLVDDRLGQCVRNLFECLELGEEGAQISLLAGENPRSALRPV